MAISKNFMEWTYEMETAFRSEKISFIKFDNQNNWKNGKKRKVGFVAVDEKTGKLAKSFCNPSDLYNPRIGRAIAYARLRDIKIPPMEETLTIKECVGKVVTVNGAEFYVSPISQGHQKNGEFSPDMFLCIKIVKPYIITNFSCSMINANVEVDSYREITVKSVY